MFQHLHFSTSLRAIEALPYAHAQAVPSCACAHASFSWWGKRILSHSVVELACLTILTTARSGLTCQDGTAAGDQDNLFAVSTMEEPHQEVIIETFPYDNFELLLLPSHKRNQESPILGWTEVLHHISWHCP